MRLVEKSKKIKVLVTVPSLASSNSPYREWMALAKYLPMDEFELTICSFNKNGIKETGPLLDALDVPYFVASNRLNKNIKFPLYFKYFIANWLIKKRGPFDIQHSFDYSSIPLEAIIAHIQGRKFIHQQRNLNEGGNTFALVLKLFFSNFVIACSPSVKLYLEKIGVDDQKISMIVNGIEITEIISRTQRIDSESNKYNFQATNFPNLVMVSHLTHRKRIEDALGTIYTLLPIFPKIILRIIGYEEDQEYKNILISFIHEHHLEENVMFLGSLNNDEVLQIMRMSDILIHCAEHEAFGWVILEAFSQELPVIAAASEGPSDIIQDGINGFLFPVGELKLLKKKIIELSENPILREKVAEQAYSDIKAYYSVESMVNKIEDVYRFVAKNF